MLRHLLNRQDELENLIGKLQQKIAAYPKEHLCITQNGNYYKWFKSDGQNLTYIPKKEKNLAIELAHKKLDDLQLKEYMEELELIKTSIAGYTDLPHYCEQLWKEEGLRSLCRYAPSDVSDTLRQWSDAEYMRNPLYPEHLQYKCYSGEFVRSKSEVIIANTLFANHIPYRYECALTLGNQTIYPDFTILHPFTLKILYWEHFGMMDVPNYCDNAFHKLKLYSRHNIVPDIHLITTYETHDYPLDSEIVQQHVQRLLYAR